MKNGCQISNQSDRSNFNNHCRGGSRISRLWVPSGGVVGWGDSRQKVLYVDSPLHYKADLVLFRTVNNVRNSLHSLEELSLQDNQLRDSQIRTFTAPLRMFNKGAISLRKLNLSCKHLILNMQTIFGVSVYLVDG